MYLSGGSSNTPSVLNITGISASNSQGTYTYTFSVSELLVAGQTVEFSSPGLSGEWSVLNGTAQTVLPTPTASSFQIATSQGPGSGSNTQTGTVISAGPINPAILLLGMMGVCSSSRNFSTLARVDVNEVSTVAMGYAMAGFASDALHIGTSATNLIGL